MKRAGWLSVVAFGLMLGGVARAGESPGNCVLSIPAGSLDEEFGNPPPCAKPRAYFFLTDLNADQFADDVKAMSQGGFIGLMYMHAGGGSVRMKTIDRALTEPWMRSLRVLMRETKKNGMEFSISLADSNGMGGPWITEDYAAKKLVYSEAQVDGPASEVALPPAVGPYLLPWERTFKRYSLPKFYRDVAVLAFREVPGTPMRPSETTASSSNLGVAENFFPAGDTADRDPHTCWKSLQPEKKPDARKKEDSKKKAAMAGSQAKQSADGKGGTSATPEETEREWVQHVYRQPLAAVGAVVCGGPEGGPWPCELQGSEDGTNFTSICAFTLGKEERKDLSFPERTARFFRLVMDLPRGKDAQLSELCILQQGEKAILRPGNQWWKFKSGMYSFASLGVYPKHAQAALAEEYPDDGAPADLKSEDVVDLTDKVTADGKLNWQVPPGRWTILRFGYNCQGAQARNYIATVNQPITDVPYEPDMMNPKVAEYSFDVFARPVIKAAIEETGRPPAYFHQDSYEGGASGAAGIQPTWTDDFAGQFKVRRGYDLRKYLPVMARRVVDSREISDRFMWDFRRTIADLWADFYERLQKLCAEHGTVMTAQCGYGTYPYPHIDGLQVGGRVALPQGEFWCYPWESRPNGENYHNNFICDYFRTAASAGRAYGRSLLTAETMTCCRGILNMAPLDSRFEGERNGLKTYLDNAFAKGLNAYQLLAWNHSWNDDKPISFYVPMMSWATMGRQMSWINQLPAWHSYVGRCQSLLRRGWPVVDVAYFTGEGSCSYTIGRDFLRPVMADGYEYDGINTEVLLTRSRVKEGRIELSGDPGGGWDKGAGMSYALLVFPENQKVMSTVLLARVKELIEAGATVICSRPLHAPGLGPVAGDDRKLKELADAMWGGGETADSRQQTTDQKMGERKLGRGRLVWGKTPGEVFQAANYAPDLELCGLPKADLKKKGVRKEEKVRWGHRRADGADIYFVVNHAKDERAFTAVFRVAGRQPEFFDPVTGEIRALPEFKEEANRTSVPLKLAQYQSGFVVFRKKTADGRLQTTDLGRKNFPDLKPVQDLSSDWQVSFDSKLGGPREPVVFDTLVDLTQRPEEGIKYYSGMAVYRKTFDCPPGICSQSSEVCRLFLDLGNVKSLAEVAVNGKELGVIWCHPMRVAIPAGLLKEKGNTVEIRPVNPWNNRIIGDGELPEGQKILSYKGTGADFLPPKANYTLMPAGLMGPVRVMVAE